MKYSGLFLCGLVFLFSGCALSQSTNLLQPAQLHLSFGSDVSSSIIIAFATMNISSTTLPTARWGTSPTSLSQQTTGTSTQYFATTAYRYINTIVIDGLQADTSYSYQVGFPDGGYSSIASFTTGPSTLRPFTCAIYGDMGTLYGNDTRASLTKGLDKYEWVFHLGDIAYSDDMPTKDYSENYDTFFSEIEPYANQKAYQVLPGKYALFAPPSRSSHLFFAHTYFFLSFSPSTTSSSSLAVLKPRC